MLDGSHRFTVVFALLSLFALSGCSSTKSAEKGPEQSETQGAENTEYEIEAYLVGDGADFIVKARGEDWDQIRPLLVDLFSAPNSNSDGAAENAGLGSLAEAANTGLASFASRASGFDLELEHLDGSRAAYLVFNPRRHSPNQACLSAGLPCVLFDSPGPRYGRLILPTDVPAKLAEELERDLGEGPYRLVEHEHHVRVEFATGSAPKARVAEHLDKRVDDEPDDDHYGRQSPARQRLISAETSFGVYADLRGAVDGVRYLEQWRLARHLSKYSESDRMEKLLAWTAGITQLGKLDMPERAEVEDVAFVLDGDGKSYAVDAIYTHTKQGRAAADRAAFRTELPPIELSSPALRVEWSFRLDKIVRESAGAEWLTAALDGSSSPRMPLARGWSWLGTLRAPSSVTATLVRTLQERTGIRDLSEVVAGRLRLAASDGGGKSKGMRGGAVLLLAPGTDGGALVQRLKAFAGGAGEVEVGTRKRSDGFVEVRIALRSEPSALFGEEKRTAVEDFAFEASPTFVERATAQIRANASRSRPKGVQSRIASGLANQGAMAIARESGESWVSYRLGFGRSAVSPHTFEAVDYRLKEPKPRCMDRVAWKMRSIIEDAVRADATDAYLTDRFSGEIGEIRKDLSDCGGNGEAESDFADWANDYFDAWYSLVRYRAGSEQWSKRILQVCEEGHEWACGPEEGQWPWIRSSD